MRIRSFVTAGLFSLLVASVAAAEQPAAPAGGPDHVAAIKQSLGKSMAALKQYQWIETTAVSIKGEEKSRTQNTCFYGADGKVQKTPVAAAPAEDSKKTRGIRGKVVENKKEGISDAAKEAVALVKQYVPPDPARIQAAKEAGKLSVIPPDAKGMVSVVIKDYLKVGDSLTITANAATDVIAGVTVATFTDSAKDTVGLKVSWESLADGTLYPATINLDVASQNLSASIHNTGYKKAGT